MSRNIVKEYIDYDKKNIIKYINIITEKKLSSKICDIITDIYINIRYFDNYEHIKNNVIDDICFYAKEEIKKQFDDNEIQKNSKLINDALLIVRYIILNEKYGKDKNISKLLINFENKLKEEYQNSKIIISDLIKSIKNDIKIKEKFINNLSSSDFNVVPKKTNIKEVYDLYFENSVKIPDLFSQVAIDRVYNSGIVSEDKMVVFYLLTEREILNDSVLFNYNKIYLLDFTIGLLNRRNKLINLLKMFDMDYLKERMVLKINYRDYLSNKDHVDELIHDGISFGIVLDNDYQEDLVLLDIFAYIIINGDLVDKSFVKKYKNVIYLE